MELKELLALNSLRNEKINVLINGAKDEHMKWLLTRQKGIGGSDAGIIMGDNKYKTPYELWQLKTFNAPFDTAVLWLHPGEERVKQMVPRILKDPHIKPSVDRLITEANQGSTGNKIEIGSYVGVYYFFAADPTTWTPAATYTRKETMTMVSIVPAKWGGGLYKPALLFEVVSGHLDGGSAAGDFTGMYCLMDKSETDTPDYHWYRYGDSVNINGMAMADVKIQYH